MKKQQQKKMILVFFMCLACNAFGQTTVTISPETQHQTVEGWGVSLAWWANLAGGWSQSTSDQLASYAVNDLNYNVFRFNIGAGENPSCTAGDHIRKDGGLMPDYRGPQADGQGWGVNNLTNDYRQINVMNKLASLRQPKGDIITEMISYSPPYWMTYGQCTAGNVSNTAENLKPEFFDDFADYLASVTANLISAHSNWNIKYIEPFNEPTSGYWLKGGNQQGSQIYPATQAQILWRLWQSKNTYNISSIKTAAADNSQVPSELSNMTTLKNNNPNEYNDLDKINTHSYGGNWQDKAQLATFAKNNGNKRIWQTETGPLSWNPPPSVPNGWWIRHYDMAYRLVEDMRNLKATVWCDWQLVSIDDGWGMVQQTNWNPSLPYQQPVLVKTKGFYCRKNVTNFIKVGYKIIESSSGISLAALSPNNEELVVVITNNLGSVSSNNIDLNKFGVVGNFRTYRTSGETISVGENTAEKTISSVSEKGIINSKILSYNAPAYSVTTFVIQVSSKIANGFYQIQQKGSGKCMNVSGWGGDNASVIQWDCVNQDNSKFYVEQQTDGTYEIRASYNNKAVTVPLQPVNGSPATIYGDFNQSNQRFNIESVGNGYYKIALINVLGKALAIDGPNINVQGQPVIVWDYYNADNFHWKFNSTVVSNTYKTLSTTKNESEAEIKSIVIYPNPAKDVFTILSPEKENSILEIFDIKGLLLYRNEFKDKIQLNKNQITSSAGLLIIKVITEKNTYTEKLVIE